MQVEEFTVNLTSAQPEALIAFYRDVVGLPPHPAHPNRAFAVAGATLRITGHAEIRGPAREPARVLLNFFVADLAAEQARLEAAGVTFLRSAGREAWGGLISTFTDPDGNYCQLIEVKSRSDPTRRTMLQPEDDAFGRALQDHLSGAPGPTLMLEVDDGTRVPAMPPDWFFLPEAAWAAPERAVLQVVTGGPVLDLGCGAGRLALHFQERGFAVTAVDVSPGAVAVCRARGVHDVRLRDLTAPPADRRWGAILLMCGNLGLAGNSEATRRLLTRLAALAAPGAVLIGDTVDPTMTDEPRSLAYQQAQREAGNDPGQVRLRLRYGALVTPWWEQLNIPIADIAALVQDTGWHLAEHLVDGADHYVVLRRAAEHQGERP